MQDILSNFALILFVLTIATGIVWFLDVFYLAKQRRLQADAALREFDARNAKLQAEGMRLQEGNRAEIEANLLKRDYLHQHD